MYKTNKHNKSYKPYILASIVLLVIAAGGLFVLEKTGVTNFYRADSTVDSNSVGQIVEESSSKPTNKIDYGPVNPDDNTSIPDKNPSVETIAPINSELAVTITSTRLNTSSTAYLIKAAVAGTSSGTCTAVASKGAKYFNTSGDIALSSGQYSCTNLEILSANIDEAGSWNIQVTVTDSEGATASTSTVMEVIL